MSLDEEVAWLRAELEHTRIHNELLVSEASERARRETQEHAIARYQVQIEGQRRIVPRVSPSRPTNRPVTTNARSTHYEYASEGAPRPPSSYYRSAGASPTGASSVHWHTAYSRGSGSGGRSSTSGGALTAKIAPPEVLGFEGEGELWSAGSRATFHATGNEEGLFDCYPPPIEKSKLVLLNMRALDVRCFGKLKLDMVMDTSSTTTKTVTLLDVAYVPGLRSNLFSLHAVQEKTTVVLDSSGVHVHLLDGGRLFFPRRESGSYMRATRITPHTPHTAVSIDNSNRVHESAHQMGTTGPVIFSCYSQAYGGRQPAARGRGRPSIPPPPPPPPEAATPQYARYEIPPPYQHHHYQQRQQRQHQQQHNSPPQ